MVVRCTRRVLSILLTPTLDGPPPDEADWYLNLLWLDRRKCLLLTHAGTLFSVLIPDVRATQLRPPGPLLVQAAEAELRAEHLPPDTFGPLDPKAVVLATTASRSVLGYMNDMTHHLRYAVTSAGGLDSCDTALLNSQLRRTPYNRGGYVYPIELATSRIAGRPPART